VAPAQRPVQPVLEAAIRRVHAQSRQTVGARGLSAALRLVGHRVGRYRAASLLSRLGLVRRRRPHSHYKRYTKPAVVAPNKLRRQFDPAYANAFWAGDITQLNIGGRWLHMAVVMDLFSRRIVGWAYGRIADARLVEEALAMALAARRPPEGLLFHSDQGCQYASERFRAFLAQHGIEQSMSRRGNCWDNAVVERFFRTLKHEWVPQQGYQCHEQAQRDLTDFVRYYNHQRPHSRLDNIPPALFERRAGNCSYQRV